jgi:hypothetical protein
MARTSLTQPHAQLVRVDFIRRQWQISRRSEWMPMRLLFASSSQIAAANNDMTQWVVVCVGVLATMYLVMRGRIKGGKRPDPMERAASGVIGLSHQRQLERDISNLMVEMLETARQMTAQLDTRAARLEALIDDADARLAALRSATAASVADAPVRPAPAVACEAPAATTVVPEPVIAPFVADSAPPAAPVEETPELESPPDPRHAEVYALADQGRSPGEIARSLNRPNGEVELILALRRG